MTHYVYILKCPNCEDEFFDFFEDAKICALRCLSDKPIITQTEVNRNDFGECTDHCDLGTVWSWEEALGDVRTDDEPSKVLFTKDDFADFEGDYNPENDPEFYNMDNSVECEPELTESKQLLATRDLKDSDYVIVLKHPNTGKYYFFSQDYKITTDINKAMTYPGKFSANDEIKYAEDAARERGLSFKVRTWNRATHDMELDTYYDNYGSENFFVMTVSEAKNLIDVRKPIPEGMTIEELVEAVEENEDTVECTKCGGLFEKARCTHNKEGFGWCCSNCEPADTLTEDTQEEYDLAEFVRDSIDHLTNDLGKDPWADDFADDVIADLENNYDIYVPEDMAKYGNWCHSVASEVSRQVNKSDSMLEELENAEAYRERLVTCPECGDKSYDTKLLFCINCGFNQG